MKLSIRIVALLAGLAAGNPTKYDKRGTDQEAKALTEFCNKSGLKDGDISPVEDGFLAVCREQTGPHLSPPSFSDAIMFCKALGRAHHAHTIPDAQYPNIQTANMPGYSQIWCRGKFVDKGAQDRESSLVTLNQIVSAATSDEGEVDGEKLKTFLQALSRDATNTLVGMYNALEAAAPKSGTPLGGRPASVLEVWAVVYDFIMANIGDKGLFAAGTRAGDLLRTNPFYGKAGTRPSPFGISGEVSIDYDPKTHMCIPFKDETYWLWTVDVKKCVPFHDKNECDTSYAYDAKTDIGKELKGKCSSELERNQLPPKEKEDQLRKEEADCILPRWACGSSSTFRYCMDDSDPAKRACELIGATPNYGRAKTAAEKEKEKETRLQNEESECFYPRLACVGSQQKFLYCMDKDSREYTECKADFWGPSDRPEKSEECDKIRSFQDTNGPKYTVVCVGKGGEDTCQISGSDNGLTQCHW
ncbi:hypothetical protein BBO_09534 [Beauveria brongniartii RCEF 3172]|uniref:Uncharacterized protein n=1 Tax=Beauveria brongniartii RCEF 3172 TaxID=1081107 RepID=A0A162ILD7_9HYPO|nr:hypothetical protein BBO_09534 [Beauveria brongniartii RCEF 3172]